MKKLIMTKEGEYKEFKSGISYTFLFFGLLVQLFRFQLKEVILVIVTKLITEGLSHLYFVFKINERYKNHLLENGWIIEKEIPLSKGLEILKGVIVFLFLFIIMVGLAIAISDGVGKNIFQFLMIFLVKLNLK